MITLASDFGAPYPAAMRGVILDACDARIVDITHDFPRQDVRTAAFWLREVLPYYPPAVHCAVVDPGVGTDRAALVVRAGEHVLVGPDNGLLLPAARSLADRIEVFEWEYETPDSATFHGRDVFAPAAATVHETETVASLDRAIPTGAYVDLEFPEPEQREPERREPERREPEGREGDGYETAVIGEVLVVDGFGNAITNIPGTVIDGRFGGFVEVNGERVPAERSYAALDPNNRLVTVGSHGNVELAVNQGRGDDAFSVDTGTAVRLEW